MKFLIQSFSLVIILTIFSCSSPLDKTFDRETAEADFARLVRMGKLDSAEAYIMSHFMVEHELIGAQVLELDATYADILEEAKEFWVKSGGKKKDEIGNEMTKSIDYAKDFNFSILPVGAVQQSEWSHGIKYHIVMENISGKSIRALKGNFSFYDSFDEKVYSIEYKYLDPIEINEKIERDVTLRIQNTASPQLLLEYGKTNPFTVKWETTNILFK